MLFQSPPCLLLVIILCLFAKGHIRVVLSKPTTTDFSFSVAMNIEGENEVGEMESIVNLSINGDVVNHGNGVGTNQKEPLSAPCNCEDCDNACD